MGGGLRFYWGLKTIDLNDPGGAVIPQPPPMYAFALIQYVDVSRCLSPDGLYLWAAVLTEVDTIITLMQLSGVATGQKN